MSKSYPSFGILLAKVIKHCLSSKGGNGKYQKITYVKLQNLIISSWLPDSLDRSSAAKEEIFNSKILEPAIDIARNFLIGLGIVDEVSTQRSIKANPITEQFQDKGEITYDLIKALPSYTDYILYRLGDCLLQSYDYKTKKLMSTIPEEECHFNDYIYGTTGDLFINAFISDISCRVEYIRSFQHADVAPEVKTLTLMENLDQDFELTRQDAPYDMRISSNKANDLFELEANLSDEAEVILEEELLMPEVDRLENRVLARIKSLSPTQFEKFSLRLMAEIANAGSFDRVENLIEHHGSTGDGGIDGIVKIKNSFGHYEEHYVQCKRYTDKTVGRRPVQEFVGAMDGHLPTMGMFITTSRFTKLAKEYIPTLRTKKVTLMDGQALVNYMIHKKIGIKEVRQEPILEIDDEFFALFND